MPTRLQPAGSARRSRRRATTAIPAPAFVKIAVTRLPAKDQAHRIGALFVNYGGPGGTAVARTQAHRRRPASARVNDHFDIVTFDPRGVGLSTPAIDCKVNQETQGIYAAPFTTPENLDVGGLLAKDKAYVKRCVDAQQATSCPTSRPPTSRATWTASAPPWATRS